jgi:hypothetical protein
LKGAVPVGICSGIWIPSQTFLFTDVTDISDFQNAMLGEELLDKPNFVLLFKVKIFVIK